MGNDGTDGCKLLRLKGARIIAQDEATCVVYGMSRRIVEAGLADVVCPLDKIADALNHEVAELSRCK